MTTYDPSMADDAERSDDSTPYSAFSEHEKKRNINHFRFNWHENLLKDRELRKSGSAVALAGYVMHRFRVDLNYAEFSIGSALRDLNMPRTTVIRARNLLEKRGWIQRWSVQSKAVVGGPWHGTRYSLAGGPEDLLLDLHKPQTKQPEGEA